jgi:hypothetical protein
LVSFNAEVVGLEDSDSTHVSVLRQNRSVCSLAHMEARKITAVNARSTIVVADFLARTRKFDDMLTVRVEVGGAQFLRCWSSGREASLEPRRVSHSFNQSFDDRRGAGCVFCSKSYCVRIKTIRL